MSAPIERTSRRKASWESKTPRQKTDRSLISGVFPFWVRTVTSVRRWQVITQLPWRTGHRFVYLAEFQLHTFSVLHHTFGDHTALRASMTSRSQHFVPQDCRHSESFFLQHQVAGQLKSYAALREYLTCRSSSIPSHGLVSRTPLLKARFKFSPIHTALCKLKQTSLRLILYSST